MNTRNGLRMMTILFAIALAFGSVGAISHDRAYADDIVVGAGAAGGHVKIFNTKDKPKASVVSPRAKHANSGGPASVAGSSKLAPSGHRGGGRPR